MNNRRKELIVASRKEYCKCTITGKTIKYNQIIYQNSTQSESGITLTAQSNGRVVINGRATSNINNLYVCVYGDNPLFTAHVGHTYFMKTGLKDTDGVVADLLVGNNADWADGQPVDTGEGCITIAEINQTPTTIYGIRLRIEQYSSFDNVSFYPMIIDLTELNIEEYYVNHFYNYTDLGKYIKKGNFLPYNTGIFLNCENPIYFSKTKSNNYCKTLADSGTFYGLNYNSNSLTISISGTASYSSGDPNIYSLTDNIVFKSNHKYLIHSSSENFYLALIDYGSGKFYGLDGNDTIFRESYNFKCSSLVRPTDLSNFDGRTYDETFWLAIIDLTQLGLTNILTANDFYKTELGLAIKNGDFIPYTEENIYLPYKEFNPGFSIRKGDTYKTYSVDEVSYNNLNSMPSGTITGWNVIASANVVSGHKYLIHNVYSRQSQSQQDTDYQVFIDGLTDEYIYNINAIKDSVIVATQTGTCNFNSATYDNYISSVKYYIVVIDLTLLGLDNINSVADFNKTPLGMLLAKGYYLPYTSTNKIAKDQIVRTFKEIDLSSLTWYYESHDMVWYANLPSDCKTNNSQEESGNIIAEKYKTSAFENEEDKTICIGELGWLVSGGPCIFVFDSNYNSPTQPSGKALIEFETPRIMVWKEIEIVDYNEWVATEYFDIWKLTRDYSEYKPIDIDADIGTKRANLNRLDDVGENNDYCLQNNHIYVKTDDIQNVWAFSLLCSALPDIMISRRIINVESKNGIDLDFSKE